MGRTEQKNLSCQGENERGDMGNRNLQGYLMDQSHMQSFQVGMDIFNNKMERSSSVRNGRDNINRGVLACKMEVTCSLNGRHTSLPNRWHGQVSTYNLV
ncbi:hypothetical protein Syun_002708 [Stephania yunnanensis]|uniref:Uncharacterized protein n=1 Tax=Stephania yunnanensis TaxID=152371 RepID=A0AAP0LH09_9MAGN